MDFDDEIDIKIQDAGKPIPGKFDLVIVDLYQGDKFPEKFVCPLFASSKKGPLFPKDVSLLKMSS